MKQKDNFSEPEQQVIDSFVVCPHCGSTLCYHEDQGEGVESMICMHCGFTTTNQMLEGSETEKAVTAKHPSLYKDLKFVDVHGFVWYPAVITVPGTGMVYVDGSSTEDWEWASTPMRKLTRKERRSGRFGQNEFVAVPNATKHFGKEGFMQAMSSLGLIGDEN